MTLPDRTAYSPTHHLLAEEYGTALSTLVETTLPAVDAAYVAPDEGELAEILERNDGRSL